MIGLRSLYDWALRQAERPYAAALLFLIAVIEPCLAPVPPDMLLIPMCIARRDKAFMLATVCTLGSIVGGLIGYGIGALAMEIIGNWLVSTYHMESQIEHFRHGFQHWGMAIIIAKGSVPVIPIPFLLVTITSGIAHFNLGEFLFSLTLARGGRFFLEAGLLYRFGDPIRQFIERYLTLIVVSVVVVVGFGIWLVLK